jgi:hypothetical protein
MNIITNNFKGLKMSENIENLSETLLNLEGDDLHDLLCLIGEKHIGFVTSINEIASTIVNDWMATLYEKGLDEN